MFEHKIIISGKDQKAFKAFLDYAWKTEMKVELNKAVKGAALFLLSEIRKRIHDKQYVANAPMTVERKGHNTPLVDEGTLLDTLNYFKVRDLVYHVGLLKDQKTSSGESTLKKIVPILHDGATIIINGKVIRIPPRPFLADVWTDDKVLDEIKKIWTIAIQKVLVKYGKGTGFLSGTGELYA